MAEITPQKFSGRIGVQGNGRLRRALNAVGDSKQRFDDSVDVDKNGRLGIKLARNSGLEMGRDGIKLSPQILGDKNHEMIVRQNDLASTATASQIVTAFNDLLSELRRTKRMR